jgi:transmembrane sensor
MGMMRVPQSGDETCDPTDAAALQWFALLQDEAASDDDRADYRVWRNADPRHAAAYDELAAMWAGLDEAPIPPVVASPGARRLSGPRIAALAAGLAAVAVTGALWAATTRVDAASPVGAMRRLVLADGTNVTLDAASAIKVDITAQRRTVRLLRGRAYFHVAHEVERPFIVLAGAGQVRDIGTGFEVARYGASGAVSVDEGVVELSVDDGPALRLTAGEAARFAPGAAGPRAVAGSVAAWRAGRLHFIDAPLPQVLSDLRRYGVGPVLVADGDLQALRLSGAIDPRNPDDALAAIATRVGARADRVGPVTIIH